MIVDSFLFSILSVALLIFGWVSYRQYPIQRIYAAAIVLGMSYWYVLPGSIFVAGVAAGRRDLYLLEDRYAVVAAMCLVLITLALLLLIPRLFSMERNYVDDLSPDVMGRIRLLVLANLAAAIASFVMSFSQFGTAMMISLLTGENTARSLMSFQNQSSGAMQSLLALLDIVVTFCTLFCISLLTLTRQVNTLNFLLSFLVIVILLIATGTRSLLLMAIFVAVMGSIYSAKPKLRKKPVIRARYKRAPFLALNAGVAVLGVIAIVSRFQDRAAERAELLLSSISAHNDMFRELIFIIGGRSYYSGDLVAFLVTPISFAMPSFLGFEKDIPAHLQYFNLTRANIDLIAGEGNVFPGLLGDAYLLTTFLTPVFVACIVAAIFLVFNRAAFGTGKASAQNRTSPIGVALLIALLAYFFISVRNLQGSLLIVALLAIGLRFLFLRSARRQ